MRTPSIDQTQTSEFPAIRPAAQSAAACPVIPHPAAWRHAFAVALILLWCTEATAAYILARIWILLVQWH